MPQTCPRCQFAQDDENQNCINCGGPLRFTADPEQESAPQKNAGPELAGKIRAPRELWKKSAFPAAALFVLGGVALLAALREPAAKPSVPLASKTPRLVSSPAPPLPSPHAAPKAAPLPLTASSLTQSKSAVRPKSTVPVTITLVSTDENRPVKVGGKVTFTALTNLALGQSASLTLSYRRGPGRNSLFSFAQGSLLSTIWTPLMPGHYDFMATALEGRQKAAVSRHISITVVTDKEAGQSLLPAGASSEKFSRTLPQETRAALRSAKPPQTAIAAKHSTKKKSSPRLFYVAAAHFPFEANAAVLAGALRGRGYHAIPERMTDKQGKAVYVVVTGSYRRAAEAHQQELILQSSGYPAYFFGSR